MRGRNREKRRARSRIMSGRGDKRMSWRGRRSSSRVANNRSISLAFERIEMIRR